MPNYLQAPACLALALLMGSAARAADIQGRVSGRQNEPVAEAQVLLRTLRGAAAKGVTDSQGHFTLTGVRPDHYQLVVLAPGYCSWQKEIDIAGPGEHREVQPVLQAGGYRDEVVVTASAVEMSLSSSPSAATVINAEQLRQLGVGTVAEALRFVPGLTVSQTGPRGGVTSVFSRGGEADFNLVLVDGVQVNDLGGGFDFANLPADGVERIEVVRGPQSALFGSDAISSVINVITRPDSGQAALHVRAEGGSFGSRRFAAAGSGAAQGWRFSGGASATDTNGIRPNADFSDRGYQLNIGKALSPGQQLDFLFVGSQAESGVPGPFGSDPLRLYSGIDSISRNSTDRAIYGLKYQGTLGNRFRQRIEGSFHDAHYDFLSPYGSSSSKQRRGILRAQGEWTLSSRHVMAAGMEFEREIFRNSFVTDGDFRTIPVSRRNLGYFIESIHTPVPRMLISAGVRFETIRTADLAANPSLDRPSFPARSIFSASPRLAASYRLRDDGAQRLWGRTMLRGSFGSGLRSPDGFEIAFTNNPRLNPEKTVSFDTGVEQQFSGGRGRGRMTFYYSRFYDLIVTVGGAAMDLSRYRSDNLANARSRGIELEGALDVGYGFSLESQLTLQQGRLMALSGSSLLAPAPFRVGQALLRRPAQTGSLIARWNRQRWNCTFTGYWRNKVLDVEPNFGLGGGLFNNPAVLVMNAGIQYDLFSGIAVYARLNNLANRKYEESFGYPSLPLNFALGLMWKVPLRAH